MRRKRIWSAILTLLVSAFALLYFILPDTFQLRTYLILPLRWESECDSTPPPVVHGCLDVVYGNYCVLSLPSEVERSPLNLGSATLCTQGSVDYLHHVSVLCERWGGPISVAVYSPAPDYPAARTRVDSLRRCDFCVRHWVSWHFYAGQDGFENGGDDVEDCDALAVGNWTMRRKSEGAYPINVGRNLARQRATTPYVFSLDIELYPSINVLSKFERMIRTSKNKTSNEPHVWVLPVFEVRSGFSAPRTKFHLRQMFVRRQAISFHRFKCKICHMIPNLQGWLNQTQWQLETSDSLESLRVFSTVKRSKKARLGEWEPFFIGTKEDPDFDIRLTWEGKQNKMQMAYEMCLKDYNFHIVENAFLVHAPGINVYNATRDRERIKYIRENHKTMFLIKKNLQKIYGTEKDC